ERGRQELDADGLLVTPGFVDIHTHYDGQASWGERMIPSAWHGVTTVVAGNCGVGFAPVHPEDHLRLIELMEGIEDIPGGVVQAGLTWEWWSSPEFMDAVGRSSSGVAAALQLPQGARRPHVRGGGGGNRAAAAADAIGRMAEIARDAVDAGALGFSTSR